MEKMPEVTECLMENCAYNDEKQCRAIAITVGGGDCPLCDTAFASDKKGGVLTNTGAVGACKVADCMFNDMFQCTASGVRITMHEQHAECGTYKV